MSRRERKTKKYGIIFYLVIGLVLLVVVWEAILQFQIKIQKKDMPYIMGISNLIIVSGSMEPNIPVGSLIFIQKVNEADIRKGDIISYKNSDGAIITHRIVDIEIEEGQKLYTTKGDNNNTNDLELFYYDKIYGKLLFQLKGFKYIYSFLSNQIMAAFAIILIILVYFLSNYIEEEYKYQKNKTDDNYTNDKKLRLKDSLISKLVQITEKNQKESRIYKKLKDDYGKGKEE